MIPDATPSSRLLGVLILAVAAVLAIALPAGHFGVRYVALGSSLQAKADVKAEVVNQAIGASPEMWRFEEHRLEELLVRLPVELEDEHARIVTDQGEIVAESSHRLAQPTITRTAQLFDSGARVGQVEVRRSLQTLLLETGLSALAGVALGGGLLVLMRRQQAREEHLANAVFDEKERARITLQSIGDAVITTDIHEIVDYLNPVAERLTQWSLAEARGKPLSEVCSLIDERTMQGLPARVAKALHDNQACPFRGGEVALVRRDGSSMAIEDSAAPLLDRHGAVIGGVMVFRDVTATRRMAQRITWAATHDSLTGLVNRREFESRVEAALLSARNSATHHVLCCLDLDQFKVINDTCGHAAGDAMLKQLGSVLQSRLRASDTLARLGGDEFGVLLEGCSLDRAQLIAAELLAAVRDHRLHWESKPFMVGVSIGLVAMCAGTGSREEVFSAADAACYTAKELGRNRVCVFQSSDADVTQRRTDMGWAARLTQALEDERLVLYYQPYLSLGQNSAEGQHIEILLRLIDEDGKVVPPGSFLPAAERYNIMPAIDRWVVKTVFSRYRDLLAQMGAPLTCAINLSGTTLNSDGILEFIREQAKLHQMPAGTICFEITETAAINNMRHATQFMRELKALGFCFALDDFGIGTSSLAYLKTLPVDYLKIDGSFVRNIVNDPIDRAMADTINRVGHIMGLQTVGEYAESAEVIGELRSLGVDFAQGYGVQRPQALPAPLPMQSMAAGTIKTTTADRPG
ncbi:MAG: GGDEF domain-containing protein [Leptothrix sp. (in: Bacteria)]|nr:GGDEF domain-containing protein [Leptothrix sp. (in: b-proteobacteria)]